MILFAILAEIFVSITEFILCGVFYTCLMYLIQPFVLFFMLLRSLKAPNYRKRLGERYGIYATLAKPVQDGIVIHAASVGEVIAATPLVKRIQKEYPHLPITFTTVYTNRL